jgi:Tfp pilus assembly protein PilN
LRKAKRLVAAGTVGRMLAAVLGRPVLRAWPLDNFGTTGGILIEEVSQAAAQQRLATVSSFQAERAGFEPAVGV